MVHKFPLPADTFPDLELSEKEADALRNLSTTVIGDVLGKYEAFRSEQRGVVDAAKWKLVKTREGVTIYQDRAEKVTRESALGDDVTVGSLTFSTKLHGLLGVGKLRGNLDDMMFGLLRPTIDDAWVKTGYVQDKLADIKILASLADPTPEEPMRCMKLMWSLVDFASPLISWIVRPRDYVYVDSVGFRETTDGQRVGYVLMRSVEIPGIHELKEHQVVRACFSFCGFYRQLDDEHLEFFMKGFVDVAGGLAKSIMLPATAEAMLSFSKSVYCGSMKKLNWALKTAKAEGPMEETTESAADSATLKPPAEGHGGQECQICRKSFGASSIQYRTLSFYSSTERRDVKKRVGFCQQCLSDAQSVSAMDIAREMAKGMEDAQ